MIFKRYQIRAAVRWLRKFKAKREGKRSYVNPAIYDEGYCRYILSTVSDDQIQEAGCDAEEARMLAREE